MEFSSSFVLFSHFILALQWFPVLATALPTYFVFHLENTVSQLCNVTSLKKKIMWLSHDIMVPINTCHMTLQYGMVPVTWHYSTCHMTLQYSMVRYLSHDIMVPINTCHMTLQYGMVPVTWHYSTCHMTLQYSMVRYLSHDIMVPISTCHMTLQYGMVPVTWHYVPVSQQYFWWAVLQSPTEGVEEFFRLHVGCTSEVNQLQMEATIQNNVFVLNSWSTEHLDMTGEYDQTNRPYQQKEQGH